MNTEAQRIRQRRYEARLKTERPDEYRAAKHAATMKYRLKNPEKHRNMQLSWRERNPNYGKEYRKLYWQRRLELERIRKYGPLPRPQGNNCELCGVLFDRTAVKQRSCYDHDHLTGNFRGWICNYCNLTLSRMGDCLDGAIRFVRYLERAELGHTVGAGSSGVATPAEGPRITS